MKALFIEARSTKKIKLDKINQLPKRIGLVSTIQFSNQLNLVKKQLENKGKKVFIGKPNKHAIELGQVLGCDVSSATNIQNKVDCFLYIGTGEFHAIGIALQVSKPVFKYNPFTNKLTKVSEKEIKLYQKKKIIRKSLLKDAKKVGILISTKPGQHLVQGKLNDIQRKLKGKQVFKFISDTINPNDLLNFPDIDIWVNTACPRLVDDQELFKKPIINAEDL